MGNLKRRWLWTTWLLLLSVSPLMAQANAITKPMLQSSAFTLSPAGVWDFDAGILRHDRGICPPPGTFCDASGDVGAIFVCTDQMALYMCRAVGQADSVGSGNFLPIPGGTMTGAITTKDRDEVIIIPDPTAAHVAAAIEFKSRGDYDNGSWFVQNADLASGVGSEDHVLALVYNGRWNNSTWTKPLATSHWARIGFESRFLGAGDPGTTRGDFEWNLDIDPNLSAGVGAAYRPWFLSFGLDAANRRTQMTVGDTQISTDDNRFEMGWRGKCGFCLWAKNGPFEFGDRPVMGADLDSVTTQGRIVIDPGHDYVVGSNRAPALINLFQAGYLDIESGVGAAGEVRELYLSRERNADVVVGTPGPAGRFNVFGNADEIQAYFKGNATQTNPLLVVDKSDGTDRLSVANSGQTDLTVDSTITTALDLNRPNSTNGAGIGTDFYLNDSAGNSMRYARVVGEIIDSTDGAEKGGLLFSTQDPPDGAAFRVRIDNGGNLNLLKAGAAQTWQASDTNPSCAAADYKIYSDLSEARMKVCNNGTVGDLPSSLSGSASLDFADPAADSCSADLTITVTGAAGGDVVALGVPNAAVVAGGQFTAWVSAADTVSVRHCCVTAADCLDPAVGTFKVRVEKP